jgi:hypothetical protein
MFCKLIATCPYYHTCVQTDMAEFCGYHRVNYVPPVKTEPPKEPPPKKTSLKSKKDSKPGEETELLDQPYAETKRIEMGDFYDPFDPTNLHKNG